MKPGYQLMLTPFMDNQPNAVSGWLEAKEASIIEPHRSDDRFA